MVYSMFNGSDRHVHCVRTDTLVLLGVADRIPVSVVREGNWETLLAATSIVLVGTAISNVVCFALWPQSATYNLQGNMTKTLDSFSTLLRMITSTFLLEEPIRKPSHEKMQRAVENHQSSFTSLKKSLAEARSEWLGVLGEGEQVLSKQAYGDAVDSLTRLAQHLNGLRSGTRLQYELSKAQRDGKLVLRRASEDAHEGPGLKGKTRYSLASHPDDLEEALLCAAAEMFGDLVDDVGPPLKALSVRVPFCACVSFWTACYTLVLMVEHRTRACPVSSDYEKHL